MKRHSKLLVFISVTVFISCNQIPDSISSQDSILIPIVITSEVKYVTQYTATCGGVVTSGGGSDGMISGICWSRNPHPTIKDSTNEYFNVIDRITSPVDFERPIIGLTGSTTYYVRAFVQNVNKFTDSDGYYAIGEAAYGNEIQFTTDEKTPTLTDADGNVYHTIQIGTQLWMLENLKTTKYNDGTDIPTVKGTYMNEFFDLLSPGYCDYFYNKPNKNLKNTFGVLYNGYAVATGKLAPIGWHVPSIDDWIKLSDYLGGDSISGGKLKSANTSVNANNLELMYLGNWMPPNTGATNSSGFSALPGGYYDEVTINDEYNIFGFRSIGITGHWWSSTEGMSNMLYSVSLGYMQASTYFAYYLNSHSNKFGFSVRCVRD